MIFIVVILAFVIPFAFIYLISKADASFTNAARNNGTLLDNGRYIKLVLTMALLFYGIILGGFLFQNSGLSRNISIENKKFYGAIVIDQVTYPTHFRTTQAQLIYHISNPVDYLFLNCGELQICYIDALLRLAILIMIIVFLWQFNFNEPFQWGYYKKTRRIWGLIFSTVFLETGANWYSNQWVADRFDHINAPHYQNISNYSPLPVLCFILVVSSFLYLYRLGVKNKEEIDLTV